MLAAAAAPLVYNTGRLRCTRILSHSVVAAVHLSVFPSTARLPRTWGPLWSCTARYVVTPPMPSSRALLALFAVVEFSFTAQRSMPGSPAVLQGAQDGGLLGSLSRPGSNETPPEIEIAATS